MCKKRYALNIDETTTLKHNINKKKKEIKSNIYDTFPDGIIAYAFLKDLLNSFIRSVWIFYILVFKRIFFYITPLILYIEPGIW